MGIFLRPVPGRHWQLHAAGLGAFATLISPSPVLAVACGDVLGPGGFFVLDDDLEQCVVAPALTVEGPVTVDLGGATISCALADDGGLAGIGILVTGFRARLSNGTVENCNIGVAVEGEGRHQLRDLEVTSPGIAGDEGVGVQVTSDRNRLIENLVEDFAGEGFRLGDAGLSADRNSVRRNEARENQSHGFRVRIGQWNLFVGNEADGNAEEGFRSQDRGNRFFRNSAIENGDEGYRVRDETARQNWLIANVAEGNGLVPCDLVQEDANPGIAMTNLAFGNHIIFNAVTGNCVGIGIAPGSTDNRIRHNVSLRNEFVDMVDLNDPQCDRNEWRLNVFLTSAAGLPPVLFPDCIR